MRLVTRRRTSVIASTVAHLCNESAAVLAFGDQGAGHAMVSGPVSAGVSAQRTVPPIPVTEART